MLFRSKVSFFVARQEGFEPERAARNRKGRQRFSRAGPQTAPRSRTADAQQMQNPSWRNTKLASYLRGTKMDLEVKESYIIWKSAQ